MINEDWIQSVATNSARLPALSPSVCKALNSNVELQVRHLIQQAVKFQKHARSALSLRVDHINLALALNRKEQLFGITARNQGESNAISLTDMLSNQLPSPPVAPEIHLHWLVVEGSQPQIPDNPVVDDNYIDTTIGHDNSDLSTELKIQLKKISSLLLLLPTSADTSHDNQSIGFIPKDPRQDRERIASMNSTLLDLRTASLQNLVPNLCLFLYLQTKNKRLHLYTLQVVVRAFEAIILNPKLNLQNHLSQVLASLFSCIVSNILGNEESDDHWSLRQYTSHVVAFICLKYRDAFPDLHARVTRTYLEALNDDKSLVTMFGGLYGLASLLSIPSGQHYVFSSKVVTEVIINTIHQLSHYFASRRSSLERSDVNKYIQTSNELSMCEDALIILVRKFSNAFTVENSSLGVLLNQSRSKNLNEKDRIEQTRDVFSLLEEFGELVLPSLVIPQRLSNNMDVDLYLMI